MFGILLWLTFPLQTNLDEAPALKVPGANASGAAVAQSNQDRIPKLLERWETTSHQQEERSTSSRQSLLLNVTQQLNGHAAVAVVQLSDQVRASQLADLFSWSIAEEKEGLVCLEARPKDETERLFFDSIRVWLDSETCQLIKLQTTDRQGHLHTNWLSGIHGSNRVEVKLASVPSAEQPENAIALASANMTSDPRDSSSSNDSSGSAKISRVSPEVDELLKKWEAASRDTKTARFRFRRTVYNLSSAVEKRADGELSYEAPDKLRMTISSKRSRAGALQTTTLVGQRKGKDGTPFRVEDDKPATLIVTANEILTANEEEKTFECVPNPDSSIRDITTAVIQPLFPLRPFEVASTGGDGKWMFGLEVRANRIVKEWHLELVNRKNNDAEIMIIAKPRTIAAKQTCRECRVLIDCQRWQSIAIKVIDPSGDLETVYQIDDQTRNRPISKETFDTNFAKRGFKKENTVFPLFAPK